MTPSQNWDLLWHSVKLACMDKGGSAYGLIEDGAIAVQDGTIAWIGSASELLGPAETLAREVRDGEGMCITPGLIDSHTHLVYAGNRAREFEMRLEGANYEELAKAGGGILSTVQATRNALEEALFGASKPRLMSLLEEGVTTVEIKSGYGLETETECRMLRVARKLESELPVSISTSFLGAHALPAEFQGRIDDYIDLVCGEMIGEVAQQGLADAVDAFSAACLHPNAPLATVWQRAAAASVVPVGAGCAEPSLPDYLDAAYVRAPTMREWQGGQP